MTHIHIEAVDFFCSGGGMTCGLRQGGIKVIAGIDNDSSCRDTYEKNNPGSRFILADVCTLGARALGQTLGLKKNDPNLVFVGCSPCQYWSVIRTDKTKSTKSRNLLLEFKRFVDYFRPGYVLVENVPGVFIKKKGSGLDLFVRSLERHHYHINAAVVNMNDYGVPQTRRRFSLLATRLHSHPIFPLQSTAKPLTLRDVIGERNGFPRLPAGHRDPTPRNNTTSELSPKNLLRLKKTSTNGGSSLDWANDKKLKRESYSGSGFADNYARMRWDKPAPTITTKFNCISNGRFSHPDENRGLSIREGATLQTFPASYILHCESLGSAARMIGNAVPPAFAKRLGKAIVRAHKDRRRHA